MSWFPLQGKYPNCDRLPLFVREAGGGGDCMFHSIAACMSTPESTRAFDEMRRLAAEQVTDKNAPDALMDMTACCPKNLSDPIDALKEYSYQQFKPEQVWNVSKGDPAVMAQLLKLGIATAGNHLWGDATIAALLEAALGVNIILLAANFDPIDLPPSPKEIKMGRDVFINWAKFFILKNPDMLHKKADFIAEEMNKQGLNIAAARKAAKKVCMRIEGGYFIGKRQPIGSVRISCAGGEHGNLNLFGYQMDRPTIIIMNRGNAHWVPVAVGEEKETLILPESKKRFLVDLLLIK
jgi:hypothetical protein